MLTGMPVADAAGAERAADALLARGVRHVVVTLGSEGALVKGAESCERVAARRVEAVDTTGAGDTFNGALAVALSEGRPLSEAVRFLTAVMKKRCTAFLLSDFLDPARDGEEFANALKIAGSKHDLVGIRVFDPREAELPDVGIVEMKDAETGRKAWVDTSSARVREHYARVWQERSAAILSALKHHRIDTAEVSTDGDYVVELIKLFKQR